METADDLASTEQFWSRLPGQQLPASYLIPGPNGNIIPAISAQKWIVLGYNLYGVPDESTDVQRKPLKEINLNEVPGVVTVGDHGSGEFQGDIEVYGVRTYVSFAPVSLWLQQTGNAENILANNDVRDPVCGPPRIGYPICMEAAPFMPVMRNIDVERVQVNRLQDEMSSPSTQNPNIAGLPASPHFYVDPVTYGTRNSVGSVPPTIDYPDAATTTNRSALDLTFSAGVLQNYDGILRPGRLSVSDPSTLAPNVSLREVFSFNRIVNYDENTGFLTLEIPILAAINVIERNDDSTHNIIESTRHTTRIHVSKLMHLYPTNGRFYGSSSGASLGACSGAKTRIDIIDAPGQQYVRDLPAIRARPGCSIQTKVSSSATLSQAFDACISSAQCAIVDVSLTPDQVCVNICDGSFYPYGQMFKVPSGGDNRPQKLHPLSLVSSIATVPPTATWTPVPNLIALPGGEFGVRPAANAGVVTLPNVAEQSPVVGGVSIFHTYIDGATVRTVLHKAMRRASPYAFLDLWQAADDASTPVIVESSGAFYLHVPQLSANIPINFDIEQGYSTGLVEYEPNGLSGASLVIRSLLGKFEIRGYDGVWRDCVPPPAIAYAPTAEPAVGLSDGVYIGISGHVYAAYGGAVVDITEESGLPWNPNQRSIDDLEPGKVYRCTENCDTVSAFRYDSFWTIADIEYYDHQDIGFVDFAKIDSSEHYGVTQMRQRGIYTDPRTAAMCARTTQIPVQLLGPLGDPSQHWTERFGNGAFGHPYYSASTLRCLIPDIRTMPGASKLYVGIGSDSTAWDQQVIRAVRACDYTTFHGLVEGRATDFRTRFTGPGRKYAFPVVTSSGAWHCPEIDELIQQLTPSANIAPAWTWIYTMISAIHEIGIEESRGIALDQRKIELLQIFVEYCEICQVPVAEVACFLSIAANIPYPGNVAKSLISVAAPPGFEVCKYDTTIRSGASSEDAIYDDLANSLLATMERVAMCIAIDTYEDQAGTVDRTSDPSPTAPSSQYVYDLIAPTAPHFDGNIVYRWDLLTQYAIGPFQSTPLSVTDIPHVPALSISTAASVVPGIGYGMGYVEDADVGASMAQCLAIGNYMLRLLPRLAMRYAVGGSVTTRLSTNQDPRSIDPGAIIGKNIEHVYAWPDDNLRWDFAWIDDGTGGPIAPQYQGSDACGYVGSSVYMASPSLSETFSGASTLSDVNWPAVSFSGTITGGPFTIVSSLGAASLTYTWPTPNSANGTLTLTVGDRSSIITGLPLIRSITGNTVRLTPNVSVGDEWPTDGDVYVNLMSLIPKADFQVYDARYLTAATAVIGVNGLYFFRESIVDTSSPLYPVAVWSPANLSPLAPIVPCLGSIRGPICSMANIRAAIPGYLDYLKLYQVTRIDEVYNDKTPMISTRITT